jgi:hypothetical protein
MTLGHLSPQDRSFDFGTCFLDHGQSSEPAGEPLLAVNRPALPAETSK